MISIIIPTIGKVNWSHFNQTLDSAAKTSPDLVSEIILIDNSCSKDFSEEIEKNLQGRSEKRFRAMTNSEQLNMAENWNHPLSSTANDWVLYLHDDDYLEVVTFNQMDRSLFEENLGFISFDFIKIEKGAQSEVHRKAGLEGILENTPKYVSTIINKQALLDIGGWDMRAGFALDFLGFIKLHQKNKSKHISKPLGYYRIHESNASQEKNRSKSYGDHLPYILGEIFKLIDSPTIRRQALFHLASFTYPNPDLQSKAFNRLLRLLGRKAWII